MSIRERDIPVMLRGLKPSLLRFFHKHIMRLIIDDYNYLYNPNHRWFYNKYKDRMSISIKSSGKHITVCPYNKLPDELLKLSKPIPVWYFDKEVMYIISNKQIKN